MAITETTVTGPIVDSAGDAYDNAVVRFTPRLAFGDDDDDTVIAQTPVQVTPAPVTGAFSIGLAPSENVTYDVALVQYLPDRTKTYRIGSIIVPASGPVALQDLLPVYDPSTPTNAELLAALSAAVAGAEAAADRAEAATAGVALTFETIADMAASDALENGDYVQVSEGDNGGPEQFLINTASTATADGALIVALTGVTGRAISTRTAYGTVAELLADERTFDDDTILRVPGIEYQCVSTGEHLTLAGGQKVKVTTRDDEGFYPADAWGSDNAAFLAAVQAVGAVYLGSDERPINLGTSASYQALDRFEVKGGNVKTDGWWLDFTGSLDGRFSVRDMIQLSGEDATGTDKNIIATRGAKDPTVLNNDLTKSQLTGITHSDHTGFPRHNGNSFVHIGTQEKNTGVNIGSGIYLFNGPVGEVLNNYFEDVWQIPIFVANAATDTFNIDGGLIAFNKIFGAMDNGIRTQPYANDEVAAASLKNVTIAFNDLHGVNIDAIRHNGQGIEVVHNTYRDWTSSIHGLIEASYMIKADNAVDCMIRGNDGQDVPVLAGGRLEIPGAVFKRISYDGNRHRGPNTAFASIYHVVINEGCHFEDVSHSNNDLEGGWHAIAVTGLNPGVWTAGTYTTDTKKSQNGIVYKVIADPSTTDDPETGVAADPATWEELAPVSKGITINGGRHVGRLRSGFNGTGFDDLVINGGEFEAVGSFNTINLTGVVGGNSVIRPDRVTSVSGFGVVCGASTSNVTTYPFIYETSGGAAAFFSSGTNNALVANITEQASVTALTDNSGGTASGTIAAIGATYDQAEVANAIASLAAKVNALSDKLDDAGVTG